MTTVVIDTNLIIAGRWNPRSSSNRIIDLVLEGKLDAIYSHEIKDENLFILEKVRPPKDYVDRILRFYQRSKKVRPTRKINVCEDKSDNRYVEAAVEGKADFIITSDRHLLVVGDFEGVQIVKPGEFIRRSISRS